MTNSFGPEEKILRQISALFNEESPVAGEVLIGDDAAVLKAFTGNAVISTDVAVWGVHLDSDLFTLEDFGFKALASAVSDIAAMGAWIRAAVIGVSAPTGTDLEALHRGISEASYYTGCRIVGGDLTTSPTLSVAVTVFGECPEGTALLRSGARPGDTLLATGPLGRSAAGLRRRREGRGTSDELVQAHARPIPRLREGLLARWAGAHALMDLSDGLGLDLHRMADASGVGFALMQVPVAEGATLEEAISGGEDYELLIATDTPDVLIERFVSEGKSAPLVLGEVVADVSVRTLGEKAFEKRGWQHEL